MASLKPIQSVLSFLTILPVVAVRGGSSAAAKKGREGENNNNNNYDIYYVAKNMYLFPVAGAVIGAIIGGMAFGISFFLHPLLVGLLVTGALVILTGVHHTDALADFADGLMAKGDKEFKHKVMRDPAVGSAGVAALVLYFAGMITVFYTFSFSYSASSSPSYSSFSSLGLKLFTSIIAAEVIAKYTMVLLANRGLSAWEGFSSPFTVAMKDRRRILAATGIMLVIVWCASSYAGMAALAVSLAIAYIMKYVSGRSFGGISGDVLGASNEMTRLSSLIVLSSSPSLSLFSAGTATAMVGLI